jgi:hypothetical protein
MLFSLVASRSLVQALIDLKALELISGKTPRLENQSLLPVK